MCMWCVRVCVCVCMYQLVFNFLGNTSANKRWVKAVIHTWWLTSYQGDKVALHSLDTFSSALFLSSKLQVKSDLNAGQVFLQTLVRACVCVCVCVSVCVSVCVLEDWWWLCMLFPLNLTPLHSWRRLRDVWSLTLLAVSKSHEGTGGGSSAPRWRQNDETVLLSSGCSWSWIILLRIETVCKYVTFFVLSNQTLT